MSQQVRTNKTSAPASSQQLPHFVQFHALINYAASLLNRDDTGLAKRIPFGDGVRLRVSSQCLKRHWTSHEGKFSLSELNVPETIRSRVTFEQEIIKPLLESNYDEKATRDVVEALAEMVLGKSEKAKKEKAKAEEKKEKKKSEEKAEKAEKVEFEPLETKQVVVLGRPEVLYIHKIAEEVLKSVPNFGGNVEKALKNFKDSKSREFMENLSSIPLGAGLTGAMMGRMATGDALSRYDAAISVSHAFTVHHAETEADYFSAIDNLESKDRNVSGHLNSTELGAGLYYVYWCVDVRQLVSNLTGSPKEAWQRMDRTLAAEIISRMVFLASMVSPGAKKGSTAPYNYASMVMVQVGDMEPTQLSDAFLQGIKKSPSEDIITTAQNALAQHMNASDGMYGFENFRAFSAVKPSASIKVPRGNMSEITRWLSKCVLEGVVSPFQGEASNV